MKVNTFVARRLKPGHYTVVCEAGHYYGMVNAPQNDRLCCVAAMAEALAASVDCLLEERDD